MYQQYFHFPAKFFSLAILVQIFLYQNEKEKVYAILFLLHLDSKPKGVK